MTLETDVCSVPCVTMFMMALLVECLDILSKQIIEQVTPISAL